MLTRFLRDDDAQDLIEYAFLAVFIGIAGWVALNSIGPTVKTTYESWMGAAPGSGGTPSLWEPAAPWASSGT